MRQTTLKDVARAAGVSVATSSRALRSCEGVKSEVRGRVVAAAKRLGYFAHPAGRPLASGRTTMVAVVVGEARGDGSTLGALRALEAALRDADCVLSCVMEDGDVGRERVLRGGAQGIIALDTTAPLLGFGSLPIARLSSTWPSTGSGGSGPGDATRLAGEYFHRLGHRRLALLATPGFLRAMAAPGLPDFHLMPVDRAGAQAGDAMARLLQWSDPPTAVFCSEDAIAISALGACHRGGIAVPTAMSILGCGDTLAARATWPALSSLRWSLDEAVFDVVHALFPSGVKRTPFKTPSLAKIVVRASTGPCST